MRKKEKTLQNSTENVEFPSNIDSIETTNKHKKKGLFSFALFKENIKSYWGSWSIVSLGNSILIIIVVMILSSLNINETKKAMTGMFQNADTEETVKTGVIGLYSSFKEAGQTYETLTTSQKMLINSLSTMYEQVNNQNTLLTLKYVETTYKRLYDVDKNHENAKNNTVSVVDVYLKNFSSMTEEEKQLAKDIVPYYIDEYYATMNDSTVTTKTRLINAIRKYLVNSVQNQYSLSDEMANKIKDLVINSINDYDKKVSGITDSNKKTLIARQTATELTFEIIPLVTDESLKEQTTYLINELKNRYEERKESFVGNVDKYYDQSVSASIIDVVVNTLEDFAYLNYLPTYKVEYITSVRGLPLIKESTGTVDSNGNIIKVSGTMGNASNMLEKKNKAIITGKEYTQKEIDQAKKEAQTSITLSKTYLTSFMNEFINRDSDNKNAYFDGKNIIDSAISEKSIEMVIEQGKKTLIDTYNSANNTLITNIEDIPSDFLGMSSESIVNLLKVYAVSGLSSYQEMYKEYSTKGYDATETMLISMTLASKTVTGSLPPALTDTLTELGSMNTYGFMVGVVAFGMACLLMPLVYTIILANGLVAEKVETGSLAFTLATPTKRNTFVFTQAVYLIISEVASGIVLLLGAILSREVGIAIGGTDFLESLLLSDIIKFTLGSVMVIIAMSGICFLSSCIFNKTRFAIGVGGGINIFFFICSILGLFGSKAMPGAIRIDSMNIFNYFTIDNLYDGLAAMKGDVIYWIKLLGLVAITAVTYNVGITYFNKKDLPL